MNKDQKNMQVMNNIESFGQSYCNEHLDELNKDLLSNDWWYALKFFFSKSFMRGRRDELSVEYCSFTIETLKNIFEIEENEKDNSVVNSKESLKKLIEYKELLGADKLKDFKREHHLGRKNIIKNEKYLKDLSQDNIFIEKLTTEKSVTVYKDCVKKGDNHYQDKTRLTNDADLMMVLATLFFVYDIPEEYENNIYLYTKTLLELNEVETVYKKINNIYYVGDKITTFFIRDIMLINPHIKFQKNDDYSYAFPIDTWVFNISRKLPKGLRIDSNDLEEIKNFYIKKAKEYNDVDPLKFAAGLWYLGANSLDILLKLLPREEISEE